MTSSWALILLYLTVLSSVIGYKISLPDESFTTGPQTTEKYSSPPLVWEWDTQDDSEKPLLTLIRMARGISDKKATSSQPEVKYPPKHEKDTKSPVEKFPVTTKIVLPSKVPVTKPQIMAQQKDKTTPLHEDHTDDGPIISDKSPTATIKTTATQMKFSTQEELSTPGSTKSKDVPVFTKHTTHEVTTFGPIHSTTYKLPSSMPDGTTKLPSSMPDGTTKLLSSMPDGTTKLLSSKPDGTTKLLSSIPDSSTRLLSITPDSTTKLPRNIPDSTTSTMVEKATPIVPKIPNTTPSKPTLTSEVPTMHGKTTGWIPDSKDSSTTPVPVTHISTTSDKSVTHSIIKQCMLAILILAVLCTIFIITTIALAAKLSTMRQKQKLRHPAHYTEMRCISSLLPESDQQSKVKPKRLKTFATMEESDGDNTTLNSFLPDH